VLIYKATNTLNGKSYIGLTSTTLEKRKKSHYAAARRGQGFHFHNALRKYKEDVWEWTILEECESRVTAGLLESKYILQHNTYESGYNRTTGGEAAFTKVVRPETRAKQSAAMTGKKFSEEHKRNLSVVHIGKSVAAKLSLETKSKMSRAKKGRDYNALGLGMAGKHHSEETRRKIAEAAKRREERKRTDK